MIVLYSTGCPKCNVLIKKLDAKGLEYIIENNQDKIISMGITSIPMLRVDETLMDFKEAVDWIGAK